MSESKVGACDICKILDLVALVGAFSLCERCAKNQAVSIPVVEQEIVEEHA